MITAAFLLVGMSIDVIQQQVAITATMITADDSHRLP